MQKVLPPRCQGNLLQFPLVGAPERGHFYFLFFYFQLGLSPLDWGPVVPTVSARSVYMKIYTKKVGNPIDKSVLIRYIYSIETKEFTYGTSQDYNNPA